MNSTKKSFDVVILDQKFVLKTDNDEDHVKRVADYVNKVMFSIKQRSNTISTQSVAILGALNIAEELFGNKDEAKAVVRDWRDRLEKLLAEKKEELTN